MQVIYRLPREVQRWLLQDTQHVFILSQGVRGYFHQWRVSSQGKRQEALVRLIVIGDSTARCLLVDVYFEIALAIAQSYFAAHDFEASVVPAQLVARWGFAVPSARRDLIS